MDYRKTDGFPYVPQHGAVNHALEQSAIDRITITDIERLECDLSFYEKVSLVFLLYGDDAPAVGLNNLSLLSHGNRKSTFLADWARSKKINWKEPLIEALMIIQAFAVVKKLGLTVSEQYERYLPQTNATTVNIHPMLKSLYFMCEHITGEVEDLVSSMKRLNSSLREYTFDDNNYLEIYVLQWIMEKLITLGSWDGTTGGNCDVKILCQELKVLEKDHLSDMLKQTENRLNAVKTVKPTKNHATQPAIVHSSISQEHYVELVNDAERLSLSINSHTNVGNGVSVKEKRGSINADKCYFFDPKHMGVCLIINQEEFYMDNDPHLQDQLPSRPLEKREGSHFDKIKLSQVFNSHKYRIIVRTNLTHLEIMEAVKEAACDLTQKEDSSLIVCILSHGQQGCVYGSNSIPVEIIKIEKLMRSQNLIGKPSWLILQSCQGTPRQKVIFTSTLRTDGHSHDNQLQNGTEPEHSDILVALSTVPGYASVRDERSGSWFIQELCECIEKYSDSKHLIEILTAVNSNVSSKRWHDTCMMPQFSVSLRKFWYFPIRES